MMTSVGGYVYLTEWGGSRRPTVSQAIVEILRRNPDGLTFSKIDAVTAAELNRLVDRSQISSALQSIGARWEPASNLWTLLPDDDQESALPNSASHDVRSQL